MCHDNFLGLGFVEGCDQFLKRHDVKRHDEFVKHCEHRLDELVEHRVEHSDELMEHLGDELVLVVA